ncbi:MAG TPA: hypothetical protein VF768_00105, partial [Holophagaceae bacterium]
VALDTESFEGQPTWRLDLEARRPALSARTVHLWVSRASGAPLLAEFHLASGKLARTVRFGPPVQAEGRTVLDRMELQEPTGPVLVLSFSRWHPGAVPSAEFRLPPS